MKKAAIVAVDLPKRVFQVHGPAADGSVVFRKKLPPTVLATAQPMLREYGSYGYRKLAKSANIYRSRMSSSVDAQAAPIYIFAAGDCCSFPLAIYGNRRIRLEAWRNAQEQGTLAAKNMLGADEAHAAIPWFWSDQYDMSLHITGLCDEGRSTVRRDLGGGAFVSFHLAEDGRLVAASGIGQGNAVAKDIRLAEMMIARSAYPDPRALAEPAVNLKKLL